jgi:hypothetical protein
LLNTNTPVPVSSVIAESKFALDGVPKNVSTPVPVVVVAGAAPAPPPMTRALAANAAEEAHVVPLEKYGTPPLVPATVRASVPEVETGEPATETIPPVNDCATEVTVPVAA